MLAEARIQLPENPAAPYRLGRHVAHDPRSLRYTVQPTGVARTAFWGRRIPVLDQGDLGSCTGNATVGVLGTEPYYSGLSPVQRGALNEAEAVRLYGLATQLDPFPGTYPPTDTGSDGLDVAKAAVKLGYLSGYQHITSVAAAQTAIVSGPFIVGSSWYDSMFSPGTDGQVHVSGALAGGHEYACFGFDAAADLWWFWNSWGDSWGKAGSFCYDTATFASLLAQDGDATVFTLATQPPPTPTPAPTAVAFTPAQHAAIDTFAASPHGWSKATKAAAAWKDATR